VNPDSDNLEHEEAHPMSNVDQAVHLALRMPLLTRVKGQSVSVVAAHNEMIKETGRAAFAKFGPPGTE
jgi:hypothetical protein